MTGQSCAIVCFILCLLAATTRSLSLNGGPSAYDDDVPPAYDNDNGRCFIILSLMATSFGIVALMNLTCIYSFKSAILYTVLPSFLLLTVHISHAVILWQNCQQLTKSCRPNSSWMHQMICDSYQFSSWKFNAVPMYVTVSNQHAGFPEEQALDDYYDRKFDILDFLIDLK